MHEDMKRILKKQHYYVVGEHSGVKLCHWMGQKLLKGRPCYKERFYGIQSHRCLQMTPTVSHCTHNCLFCWRFQGMNELAIGEEDDPIEILDGCIHGQRKLITGYKGDERCSREMWDEAYEPDQVAISLSGEPTLYSRLGEFIAECHRRNMTTFVVSNGLQPEVLEKLERLDDLVFGAIAESETLAEELRSFWPEVRAKLGEELIAESREQYLRYALSVWERFADPADPADAHRSERAIRALDVLCVLFDEV